MPHSNTIAVLGAGSWGTALAMLIAHQDRQVLLWGHDREHICTIGKNHSNDRYLPGFTLPNKVMPTADFLTLTEQTREFVIAVPSHAFRSILSMLRDTLPVSSDKYKICWGTKGVEVKSGKLLSEVFDEVIGTNARRAVISGPSFAREVAACLPTALTVASPKPVEAERIAEWFRNEHTRVYTSTDITGVQLGGAIKNVMAIAAGISDGLGFGANARAALMTRGLSEMVRYGVALGGQADTFMGLTGIGDLVLTCTDDQSRNRRVGLGIGAGRPLDSVLLEIGQKAEGIDSVSAIHQKSSSLGIEMPITEQIYRVLFEKIDPAVAVTALLERDPKPEIG